MIIVCSCTAPKYLPTSDKIDGNEYGSYIQITAPNFRSINGELIAIDTKEIVVLTEKEQKCVTVPLNEVHRFSLHYAKGKNYGWTIPVGMLVSCAHGAYAIFTLPINLIVTISVTSSGANDFKFNERTMTYDKLRMYARFPQGIPATIDISSIK